MIAKTHINRKLCLAEYIGDYLNNDFSGEDLSDKILSAISEFEASEGFHLQIKCK